MMVYASMHPSIHPTWHQVNSGQRYSVAARKNLNDPSDDSLDFLTPLVLVLIMHYANLMAISDAFQSSSLSFGTFLTFARFNLS